MKYNVEARGRRLLNIRMDGGKASNWVTRTIDADSNTLAKSKASKMFGETAECIKVYLMIPIGSFYSSLCIGTKRKVVGKDGVEEGANFGVWKDEDINEEERLDAEMEERIEKWKLKFKK